MKLKKDSTPKSKKLKVKDSKSPRPLRVKVSVSKKQKVLPKNKSVENLKDNSTSKIKSPPTEYKRVALFDKKKPVVLNQEETKKLRITESKIKQLLDVSHLEELFHILELLNEKQIEKFLNHYKEQKLSNSKDQKIDLILKKSSTRVEILDKLKKQLTDSVKSEYEDARREISFLRKKGLDVYVEDLKSMKIPLKMRMFNATSSKKDFYAIKKVLEEVNIVLKEKREEFEKMIEDKEAKAKVKENKQGDKKEEEKKSAVKVKSKGNEKIKEESEGIKKEDKKVKGEGKESKAPTGMTLAEANGLKKVKKGIIKKIKEKVKRKGKKVDDEVKENVKEGL